MPTYNRSAITAKEGLNFIRSAVESGGSLFLKIDQENDFGIDALIEFFQNKQPLNKQIAVQIKSGNSYYQSNSCECVFPTGSHIDYWLNHPLPVYGIVYVTTLRSAYWINIKDYFSSRERSTTIRFRITEANRLELASFERLFLPAVTGGIPDLDYSDALRLSRSRLTPELYLGLIVLFRRYPNRQDTWDAIVDMIRFRPVEEIPKILIYWLAHIPWHGDIFYSGEMLLPATRAYARTLLAAFDQPEVIKLLSFIDSEGQISRGAIGQSVEAIISDLPSSPVLLRSVLSSEIPMNLREYAAIILAMNIGKDAQPYLEHLAHEGSWYADQVLQYLKEYGGINPYL